MAKQTVDPQVQEALWDLQRYLSDEVAPMMVTDSIEILLRCHPEVAADEIQGWLADQTTGPASDVPVSDRTHTRSGAIDWMQPVRCWHAGSNRVARQVIP